MKFEAFLLADAISAGQKGVVNVLGAGVTRITPTAFPHMQGRLDVLVRMILEDADSGRAHTITVRVIGPDGETVLFSVDAQVTMNEFEQTEENRLEDELRAINLIANINNLVLPEPGTYEFTVAIDREIIHRYPVAVRPAAGHPH